MAAIAKLKIDSSQGQLTFDVAARPWLLLLRRSRYHRISRRCSWAASFFWQLLGALCRVDIVLPIVLAFVSLG